LLDFEETYLDRSFLMDDVVVLELFKIWELNDWLGLILCCELSIWSIFKSYFYNRGIFSYYPYLQIKPKHCKKWFGVDISIVSMIYWHIVFFL
jgi:hypothetical protein